MDAHADLELCRSDIFLDDVLRFHLSFFTSVIGQVRRTIIYYVMGYVFIGRVRTLIISYVVGRACCNVSYIRMFHCRIPLKCR